MKATFFIFATFLRLCSDAQIKASNLDSWNSYSLPIDSITLEQYNFSNCEWRVHESGNCVFASEVERNSILRDLPFKLSPSNLTEEVFFQHPSDIIMVNDGYLISFNRGEFGGYLYWFSSDGIHNKQIALSRISKFITRENKIYAIDGIGHGINMGSIVELKKKNGDWLIEKYLELSSDPRAITLDANENFLVVTSHNMLLIDKKKNISRLIEDGFWLHLYPNSIITFKDVVYIGMRKGVLKYDNVSRKMSWLIPE